MAGSTSSGKKGRKRKKGEFKPGKGITTRILTSSIIRRRMILLSIYPGRCGGWGEKRV